MIKRQPICQRLDAASTQTLFRRSLRLLPVLARRGVSPADALAVAFNTCFLYYFMPQKGFMLSPKGILRKYSYAQIASLCESLAGSSEYGVNTSFKEVLP